MYKFINKIYFYKIIFILLILTFCIYKPCISQIDRQVNRIFIWDVTLSMRGFGGGEDIWDDVVLKMIENIRCIPEDEGNIIIIPFQEHIIKPVYTSRSNDEGKEEAIDFLRDFKTDEQTNTNICKAWEEAFNFIAPNRKNYIYIYTDGRQNSRQEGYEPSCLRELAGRWCENARSNPNCYGVYITLKSDANLPDDLKSDICEQCPENFTCSETGIPTVIDISPRNDTVHLNLGENEFTKFLEFDYHLTLPVEFQFNINIDNNDYVDIINERNNRISNDRNCRIEFRCNISENEINQTQINEMVTLRFEVSEPISNYHISFTPQYVTLSIKNVPERILKIKLLDDHE